MFLTLIPDDNLSQEVFDNMNVRMHIYFLKKKLYMHMFYFIKMSVISMLEKKFIYT